MKKQNIWLWALTAAVVLLAAALAETQGQLGELQTAYSALQQEVGELRLDLKSTQNRQLSAQYPTEEMIERSAVMSYFDTEENARINQMWINVRCYNIENVPVWAWIVTGLVIAGLIVLAVRKHFKKKVYIK